MRMLILPAEIAEAVTGPTANGAELLPRPLADGTFALPVRVLMDPKHQQHHEVLRWLPLRESEDCDWMPDPEEG